MRGTLGPPPTGCSQPGEQALRLFGGSGSNFGGVDARGHAVAKQHLAISAHDVDGAHTGRESDAPGLVGVVVAPRDPVVTSLRYERPTVLEPRPRDLR